VAFKKPAVGLSDAVNALASFIRCWTRKRWILLISASQLEAGAEGLAVRFGEYRLGFVDAPYLRSGLAACLSQARQAYTLLARVPPLSSHVRKLPRV